MSLDWQLTKIRDYETVCLVDDGTGRQILNPRTNALIYATMAVGMGDITEKNAPEFYARVRYWDLLHGIRPDERITPADVWAHVGLHTNVSMEGNEQWLRRIWARARDDGREAFHRAIALTPADL